MDAESIHSSILVCNSAPGGNFLLKDITYIFVSFYDSGYSRSGALLHGLAKVRKTKFHKIQGMNPLSAFKLVWKYRKTEPKIYVVMSPNQYFSVILRFFTCSDIILDSGWSLYESELSRQGQKKNRLRLLKLWTIDYLASLTATKILVESDRQKRFYVRKFKVKEKKVFVGLTGFNEGRMEAIRNVELQKRVLDLGINKNKPIILFRGKTNQEAGLEVLIQNLVAGALNNFLTVIVTDKGLATSENLDSTIVFTDFLNDAEIAEIYRVSDIALGQLSRHKRLENTIPHKIFEAAYFGVPIVSADSQPLRDVFGDTGIKYFAGGSPSDFQQAIFQAISDIGFKESGLNLRKIYDSKLSVMKLTENFLEISEDLAKPG